MMTGFHQHRRWLLMNEAGGGQWRQHVRCYLMITPVFLTHSEQKSSQNLVDTT